MRLRGPVEGCQGEGVTSRNNPRFQFAHHHMRDAILILEEGNQIYLTDLNVTCLYHNRH